MSLSNAARPRPAWRAPSVRRALRLAAIVCAAWTLPAGAAAAEPMVTVQDLLKNPQFKTAYFAALGPKAKEKWLREMTNSSLVRSVRIDGDDYQVAAPCKPHDCGDNNLLVIYSPTKGAVYGSLHEKGSTTLIGAPGPALGAELARMWKKEFRQQ